MFYPSCSRTNYKLSGRRELGGGDKGGFSLADIPIGTHLYRYFSLDLPRPDLPNVERPYRRLLSRPAHRAQSAYLWTSKGGLISDTDR